MERRIFWQKRSTEIEAERLFSMEGRKGGVESQEKGKMQRGREVTALGKQGRTQGTGKRNVL